MNILSPQTFSGRSHPSSAELITLKNKNGLVAQFTNYGARWVSMWTPDRDGKLSDIILGFDTLDGYLKAGERYHGAIVGRVCGRISNARFRIGEEEYLLASNDAYGTPVRNHLHGGIDAFHNSYWQSCTYITPCGEEAVEFTKSSDESSGRNLEIYTNQSSLQIYNGYFMDGTDIGKNATPYYASAGIALETQGFPDAPNQPAFPSILIDKSISYKHITEFRFVSM